MKNIFFFLLILFFSISIAPLAKTSDLVICENSSGKISMSNTGICPSGYSPTSRSSSETYANPADSSTEYDHLKIAEEDIRKREAFEQKVFRKIGGNPFKLHPEKELERFKREGGQEALFNHVFDGQLSWINRKWMNPEQKQFWNQTLAGYRSRIIKETQAKKARLKEEYDYHMSKFDRRERDFRTAREKDRVEKMQVEKRARAEADQKRSAKPRSSSGTGFIISEKGHIITCYHVIYGSTNIEVVWGNSRYNASVIDTDEYNDLALLTITNSYAPINPLPFSNNDEVQMGESVFTIGFPNPGIQGRNAKLTKGEISSLTGFQDDNRLYQISVPVQPGNSGGPLIDSFGNIVGVVVAELDAQNAFKLTGAIPQNVNYAIKEDTIKSFLDSLLISIPHQPNPNSVKQPFLDVVSKAKTSVVMVIANR